MAEKSNIASPKAPSELPVRTATPGRHRSEGRVLPFTVERGKLTFRLGLYNELFRWRIKSGVGPIRAEEWVRNCLADAVNQVSEALNSSTLAVMDKLELHIGHHAQYCDDNVAHVTGSGDCRFKNAK